MRNRIAYYISVITLVIAFILLCVVIYWWGYPYKVNNFQQPFKVLTPVVKQGGLLQYQVHYCKSMNLGANVTSSFANGIIYVMPTNQSKKPVGCHTIVISVVVPSELPPSTYHIMNVYSYQVNPIRTIDYVVITGNFKVVK